jgi:hypothetical protein
VWVSQSSNIQTPGEFMQSEKLFDFNEFSQNWTSGSIIADSQFADDKWTLFKKVFFNNRVFFETNFYTYNDSPIYKYLKKYKLIK